MVLAVDERRFSTKPAQDGHPGGKMALSPATRLKNSPEHHQRAKNISAKHTKQHASFSSSSSISSAGAASKLSLSFRSFSFENFRAAYVAANARSKLILMLALWRNSSTIWSLTTATFGFGAGLLAARFCLPRLRLYAVFLRRELVCCLSNQQKQLTAAVLVSQPQTPTTPRTPEKNLLSPLNDGSISDEERDVMTAESPVPRRMSSRRRTIIRPIAENMVFDGDYFKAFPPERFSYASSSRSASPVRHAKRLSLNFPITGPSLPNSRPHSIQASPTFGPELKTPTETNFLTVLAAQERRVLELKEELKQAEESLLKLKNQWSSHELTTRKQQARPKTLQPLLTNLEVYDSSEEGEELDESQIKAQQETDRRKALISGIRSSGRKVFSGSKHTRALSLLSPDKTPISATFASDSPQKRLNPPFRPRPLSLSRAQTSPNVSNDLFTDITGLPKDAFFVAGKQMMGDVRETFWNFVGDIRQATVGSEAINGPTSNPRPLGRSKSQKAVSSIKQNKTTIDSEISSSFWKEHGILESPHAGLRRSSGRHTGGRVPRQSFSNGTGGLHSSPGNEEAWDSWVTPTATPSKQNVTAIHGLAPVKMPEYAIDDEPPSPSSSIYSNKSGGASTNSPTSPEMSILTPQTAMSDNGWPPILAKLAPEGIKRTAHSLANDWEQSVQHEDTKGKSD